MSKRFCELSSADLARLPCLTYDHYSIGEERIHLHLYNEKEMHWYLAEYGPIGKKFFGFFVNKTDGIASGFCSLDEILSFEKRGGHWAPMVDEYWQIIAAKEIPILVEYIKLVVTQPDIT
ncbi:MAG: hypothetical protein LUQ02_00020 [Methanothrix sp.]|nr:hypothetical protein [Methanothrix sp.]MDD1737949.1 hypothetical protein [Methanothrix sp.]